MNFKASFHQSLISYVDKMVVLDRGLNGLVLHQVLGARIVKIKKVRKRIITKRRVVILLNVTP